MNIYEERFKPLFLSSGMTDKDLETSIGLPRGIIYKWEHQLNKSFEKYCGLVAKYFDVSADYLLGTSEKKEKLIPKKEDEPISEKRQKLLNAALTMDEKDVDLAIKIIQSLSSSND